MSRIYKGVIDKRKKLSARILTTVLFYLHYNQSMILVNYNIFIDLFLYLLPDLFLKKYIFNVNETFEVDK